MGNNKKNGTLDAVVIMVASAGLEPARRIAPQDFKSRLSTDSNKRPY